MPAKKVRAPKIKVGDCIGTPGDRKKRIQWGLVDSIEKEPDMPELVTFESFDWASPNWPKGSKGAYYARTNESLPVDPAKCKRTTPGLGRTRRRRRR